MPRRSYAATIPSLWAGAMCVVALAWAPAFADDCMASLGGQARLTGTIALQGPGADDLKAMTFTAQTGDAAEIVMRDAKGKLTTLSYDRGLIASEPLASGIALGTPVTLDFVVTHSEGDIYGFKPGVTRYSESVSSDDKPQFQVEVVQTVGARGRRKIGACAFDVVRRMRVETLIGTAQQRTTQEDFSPTLGFPLWSELANGEEKTSMEITSLAVAP